MLFIKLKNVRIHKYVSFSIKDLETDNSIYSEGDHIVIIIIVDCCRYRYNSLVPWFIITIMIITNGILNSDVNAINIFIEWGLLNSQDWAIVCILLKAYLL